MFALRCIRVLPARVSLDFRAVGCERIVHGSLLIAEDVADLGDPGKSSLLRVGRRRCEIVGICGVLADVHRQVVVGEIGSGATIVAARETRDRTSAYAHASVVRHNVAPSQRKLVMRTLGSLMLCCAALMSAGQAVGGWQKPGEIQRPSGTWQQPGSIQKAGDIQKVATPDGCRTTLVAPADALFAFDRSELGAGAQATLAQIAATVAQRAPRTVVVHGYTDGKGDDAYNRRLSQARADAVRAWLEARVSAPIRSEAHGKSDPVAPNTHADGSDDPEGRARNRRVAIVLEYCRA